MSEDKGEYNFSRPFKNRQKVLFRFDDDEPVEICIMDKETEFSISLNDNGTIQFEKNGKTLTIYTEDIK